MFLLSIPQSNTDAERGFSVKNAMEHDNKKLAGERYVQQQMLLAVNGLWFAAYRSYLAEDYPTFAEALSAEMAAEAAAVTHVSEDDDDSSVDTTSSDASAAASDASASTSDGDRTSQEGDPRRSSFDDDDGDTAITDELDPFGDTEESGSSGDDDDDSSDDDE